MSNPKQKNHCHVNEEVGNIGSGCESSLVRVKEWTETKDRSGLETEEVAEDKPEDRNSYAEHDYQFCSVHEQLPDLEDLDFLSLQVEKKET